MLSCRICKESTHNTLLGCPELLEYIPGNPEGSQTTPKLIFLNCWSTVYSRCRHYAMPDHKKYFCPVGKQHVILCRCTKYENMRTWRRTNFNPSRGIHNLDSLWKEIKVYLIHPRKMMNLGLRTIRPSKANQLSPVSPHSSLIWMPCTWMEPTFWNQQQAQTD